MRVVYLDESGTSRREPLAVVAGVIVDGDQQMIAVEEHLARLVRKHIPEPDQDNFFFHATNIWSGTKYYKDRDAWPLDRRLEVLRDLVDIPQRFGLPIVFGRCPRNEPIAGLDEHGQDIVVHCIAFYQCVYLVEKTMREVWPDEVALLIAEDRPVVMKTLRDVQSRVQKKSFDGLYQQEDLVIRHIRDTVHWAGKKQSPLLQLADARAFVIRGHLNEKRHAWPLYEKIRPMMVAHPKSDESVPHQMDFGG